MAKKLMRSEKDEQFLGVAAGLAHYLDVDVTIVRLLFVFFTLMGGPGILVYLVLALVMPTEDSMIEEQITIEKGPQAA